MMWSCQLSQHSTAHTNTDSNGVVREQRETISSPSVSLNNGAILTGQDREGLSGCGKTDVSRWLRLIMLFIMACVSLCVCFICVFITQACKNGQSQRQRLEVQ